METINRRVKSKKEIRHLLKKEGFVFDEYTLSWVQEDLHQVFTKEMFDLCESEQNFLQSDSLVHIHYPSYRLFQEDWLEPLALEQRIENYLANPFSCPYCFSEIIMLVDDEAEDLDDDLNDKNHTNNRKIKCENCKKEWLEKYKLVSLKPLN